MTTKYVPAAEVLRGIELAELTEGWTPIDAIVLIRCIDAEGNTGWLQRISAGVGTAEVVGALVCSADTLRKRYCDNWEAED